MSRVASLFGRLFLAKDKRELYARGWEYYEHVQLPRCTIGEDGDEHLAEPGESELPTHLFRIPSFSMAPFGELGVGIGIYFSTLVYLPRSGFLRRRGREQLQHRGLCVPLLVRLAAVGARCHLRPRRVLPLRQDCLGRVPDLQQRRLPS